MFPLDTSLPPFGSAATGNTTLAHRPAKNKSNERPTREEMQKKRQEIDAKIKSILTDEQYKKYQDMRKKDNAKKKKKAK